MNSGGCVRFSRTAADRRFDPTRVVCLSQNVYGMIRACRQAIPATLLAALLLLAGVSAALPSAEKEIMGLPEVKKKGSLSVEEAIQSRRTRRDFSDRPLTLEALAQLLWAAQGVTGKDGRLRTAPSAGALYPLDVYVVVGGHGVEGMNPGVYHYVPPSHQLESVASGDLRDGMAAACLGQSWMARAPVSFVVTAEYKRSEIKYGPRAERYCSIEAGHVGQNIFLQAEALGLAAGIVGAFDDERLARLLGLPSSHKPLVVMPVGYRK